MRDQDVVIEGRPSAASKSAKVPVRGDPRPRGVEYVSRSRRRDSIVAAHVRPDQDRSQLLQSQEREDAAFHKCKGFIEERRLQMELVDVEHLFGGERVIFYFLAEKRVDFRELVKDLAREFRTRIEMRQIGVRDEAKLLADYGDCGKPVCCNTHMAVMPPVSMKMAKLQKSTLDPSKISGRCGRLKCCLRFEQDVYEEFQQLGLNPRTAGLAYRDQQGTGACWRRRCSHARLLMAQNSRTAGARRHQAPTRC